MRVRKLKFFKIDRGREYLSKHFQELCEKKRDMQAIDDSWYSITKWCCKEKELYSILEMVRSMMVQATFQFHFAGMHC